MPELVRATTERIYARDKSGKFAAHGSNGAPSFSSKPLAEPAMPRRSLPTSSSVWRTGAAIPALPTSYTGDSRRSHEVGTFLHHEFKVQIPPGMGAEPYMHLVRHLSNVVNHDKIAAIDKGRREGYIPEGTRGGSVIKAFRHGALLAMHDFGIGHYKFAMDDHLKSEMTPLVPFIRYARRRAKSNMLAQAKGQSAAFKRSFGKPFKDNRTHKITGELRYRLHPNDVLVKNSPG